MPANEFMVTLYNDRVVSLRLFRRQRGEEVASPMNLSTQEACELAVCLILAAGMGEHMSAEEAIQYFRRGYAEATGRA